MKKRLLRKSKDFRQLSNAYYVFMSPVLAGISSQQQLQKSMGYASVGKKRLKLKVGYRPDAIFNQSGEYWGITFIELPIERFDSPTPAILKFTFQESHYDEISVGQPFAIMEGSHQIGEGKIIAIEKTELCD